MRRARPMPRRFEALATYNTEVARGLMHTPEWTNAMGDLQVEFDIWSALTTEPTP